MKTEESPEKIYGMVYHDKPKNPKSDYGGEAMTNLPRIRGYGRYEGQNYGAHCLRVEFDALTLWYSYGTIVAFRGGGYPHTVRENDWGPTTGKHLNWIDGGDKRQRMPGEKFEAMLQDALVRLGLSNPI